ncbi:tetratricopeptide repeat protein [Schauerella aestuarii]|uniref:hypothetical protein n=1 Tax=Schauerella aestuarii TaxID=2511204 RepID=UPI00136D6BE6|nr:hypothetical protein [Achromobacter aestuarii]MYZ45569.1 hypothetical protein [Achromobacter aestuarii]
MRHKLYRLPLAALALMSAFAAPPAWSQAASAEAGVASIQQEWALIQYQTEAPAREAKFEALAARAHTITAQYPQRAEPHIWEGIVLSSWANARGGLGALGLAKQAKAEYETAIGIDPKALDGSALSSLGVLYYKVPGWPVGFGDNKKAEALLKQALAVSPNAIDTNFFYADYLAYRNDKATAVTYLQKALAAPPRPGREVADAGRRDDIRKLMAEVKTGN